MNVIVALFLVSCLGWCGKFAQVQGQGCSFSSWPSNLTIKEGTLNGTYLLNASTTGDVEFVPSGSTHPPFIGLDNGSLYFNATVDLDHNPKWCDAASSYEYRSIDLRCIGGQDLHFISISIQYTNDYPPEFTGNRNLSTAIMELSKTGTSVVTFVTSDLVDRDCNSNFQFDANTVFQIEGGNEDGAFSMFQQNGGTTVNRTLDYEHGDTRFVLNISVSDKRDPDKKSFTTAEISIIDIDDNNPVFNHTSYVLHVAENNNSSIGEWRQTDPPVAVHDPDRDSTPKDPLLISLYDTTMSSLVKVNETTGEICLNQTFDREDTSSFNVVLKVQQTINSWRSSTATLTLVIDDVNDNRPQFQPYIYDVTIAEHSPSGTSVVLVSATDLDSGLNAVFNYTLRESGEAVFSLSTVNLGDERYGLLHVHNSSLLDRELFANTNVTIGTEELTMTEACIGEQYQATVTIHLQDINDNSPLFDWESYDVIAHDFTPQTVIVTVNATDADQGSNANVTYELRSYGSLGCSGVMIDSISGDVRLSNTVTQSEVCLVTVTACDNPLSILQQRCSSVPMQVTIYINNNTVVLQAPVPSDVLLPEKDTIETELSSILGVNVTVDTIFPDSSERSRVFISAKNTTTWEPLPKAKLQSLVEEKSVGIASMWDRYRQSMTPGPDTGNDTDFSPLIIVLIVLSVVFLLAFIVAVAFVYRFHKSGRRQQRLIQRLTGVNDLYTNTAALGKAENGDASLTTNIEIPDGDSAEGIGVINPVFMDDSEENSPADTPRSAFDEGGEAEVTESTRLPDADSGVPSDRENGMDSDSSKETTPVMRRSEGGSLGSRGGSAYLHAVLMTSEDDVNDGADDMIDVTTMSPSDPDDPEPDYVNTRSNPPPDVIVDPSTGNYEEQENTMTFTDSSEDLSLDTTFQSTHGSHDAGLQPVDTGRHPGLEEEDEDVGVGSKLAMLMRPSTPPIIHRPSKKEEEEEEEEILPEEPEPDYAKKVRFRVRVTEHVNPQHEGEHPAEVTGGEGEGRGDDDGGREEVDLDPASPQHAGQSSEHTENVAHPEEKNDPEKPDITKEGAKTAFNTEEETTSF